MSVDLIIKKAISLSASDVHIVCGIPVRYRVHGRLKSVDDTVLTHEMCDSYARKLADDSYSALEDSGELDIARTRAGMRLRINIFKQQGHFSVAIRLLSSEIPRMENLGLPPAVINLASLRRGIVLVTGETGSGKSTTLAAILGKINNTRPDHILTLEDPIEYIYDVGMGIVNQREIGKDTQDFSQGLRAALREDPDVILIGEMRDVATIETAMTAAETGHLVLATLHTNSAADSIDRIVDVFPQERHRQIRMQLSMTLKAVVAQQLIPNVQDNGRALACEVMVITPAIRNLIREGKTPMIQNAIATTASAGAITMDSALVSLVRGGRITSAAAIDHAYDVEQVRRILGVPDGRIRYA